MVLAFHGYPWRRGDRIRDVLRGDALVTKSTFRTLTVFEHGSLLKTEFSCGENRTLGLTLARVLDDVNRVEVKA